MGRILNLKVPIGQSNVVYIKTAEEREKKVLKSICRKRSEIVYPGGPCVRTCDSELFLNCSAPSGCPGPSSGLHSFSGLGSLRNIHSTGLPRYTFLDTFFKEGAFLFRKTRNRLTMIVVIVEFFLVTIGMLIASLFSIVERRMWY